MALTKAASFKAESDLIPARNNSVFFTVTLSRAARCFMASKTSYSALGKVKLSRTNFGFFSLAGFAAAVLAAGDLRTGADFAAGAFFAAGLVLTVEAGRLTGTRLAAAGRAF